MRYWCARAQSRAGHAATGLLCATAQRRDQSLPSVAANQHTDPEVGFFSATHTPTTRIFISAQWWI